VKKKDGPAVTRNNGRKISLKAAENQKEVLDKGDLKERDSGNKPLTIRYMME